jgi:hypothetical protein
MAKNRFIHNLKNTQSKNNSYIILSAGRGTRKRYSAPEGLTRVGSKYLIDHQIASIRKFDKNCLILLVVGFLSEHIIDYVQSTYDSVKIIDNVNFKETTSAGSLKLVMNLITDSNLYVIHGSKYFNSESLYLDNTSDPVVFINGNANKSGYNIGVSHQKSIVKQLCYGLDDEWAEIFFIPESKIKQSKLLLRQVNSHEEMYKLINVLVENIDFRIQKNKDAEVVDASNIKAIV